MADRESFLIRVDPELLQAIRHAAREDMRSVNRQIEFLLKRALRESNEPSKKQGVDGSESDYG